MPKENGAALIITLGALTLLLSLGTAFVLNMLGENRQTEQFVGAMQARLAAQAGLARAMAELRLDAQSHFPAASGQTWYFQSDSQPSYARAGQQDSGLLQTRARYTLNIVDLARRMHVNDTNPNLESLLANLPVLGPALAQHIVTTRDTRMPNNRYLVTSQIKLAAGIGDNNYLEFRDFVDANGYQDPNTMDLVAAGTPAIFQDRPRSPVNVNTASREVLAAVLRTFLSSGAEAAQVADNLIRWQRRGTATVREMATWQDYETWLRELRGLSDAELMNLRDNVNPNRKHAWERTAGNNMVRKYGTEFCFHSGGYYEIRSTGEALGMQGNPVAAVTVSCAARIFKIVNQTKREQFAGEDANANWVLDPGEDTNGNGFLERPEFRNVTWADDCPVNLQQETPMGYVANYDRVNDSLKLGFWDDFEDAAFSKAVWVNRDRTNGSAYEIRNSDTRNQAWELPDDNELHHTSKLAKSDAGYNKSRFGEIELSFLGWRDSLDIFGRRPAWSVGNAYYRVDVIEDDAEMRANAFAGQDDVGRLGFRGVETPIVWWNPSATVWSMFQVYGRYPGIDYYNWPAGSDNYRKATIYQHPMGDDSAWWADNKPGKNPYNRDKAVQEQQQNPGAFPILQEEDTSSLPRALIEGPVVATDNDTYKESCIKFPERVVFVLGDSPPPDGVGINKFVFGSSPGSQYHYRPRRTYRLVTINRLLNFALLAGVRLQLSQEIAPGNVEELDYPEPTGQFGGEINTWMSPVGTFVLKNNASFPSWDNVRIITPVGEYKSQVIDAGTSNVLWGTIAWTATLPASADPQFEKVSFETVSRPTRDVAEQLGFLSFLNAIFVRLDWQTHHWMIEQNTVGSGLGIPQSKGFMDVSGYPIVSEFRGFPAMAHHGHRYLLYKATLTSERYADLAPSNNPARDDPHFLRETPVLEDVTVTYIPRTQISGYREGA